MKPTQQTKFGWPDGNCHAATLASILELDINEIPNFGVDDHWWDRFSRYMVSHHGMQPIEVDAATFEPQGYHFINGKSPRLDHQHSLVGFAGKPVHDPYPNGQCELRDGARTYTLLILLDPSTQTWRNPNEKT